MKKLITSITLLQFILLLSVYPQTLTVNEQGDVLAETHRYTARFQKGVLTHFHNKLTQETYTQGESEAITRMKAGRSLWAQYKIPEIKRHSPLKCLLIYKDTWGDNNVQLHLFIGIDSDTGELLVRQKASSETGGIERIMWGFSNLSESVIDVIAPVRGGQILVNSDRYHYPAKWRTPLVILQGQRGGVFVRSDDTQYRFKTLEYRPEGGSIAINFWEIPQTPFDQQKEWITATWRVNAYQGSWEVPALEYREWMHAALKPVNRTEMPAWVKDIELVIIHADPLDRVETSVIDILSQYVDPHKTMLYVTGWRKAGWSLNYPDQTPTDNFGEFIKKAHKYGFKVMLHTNMAACSLLHPLYSEFEKYAMIDEWSGEKIGTRLNSATEPLKRQYIWINPASNNFRRTLVNGLKNVWETYRVDAFHLDISDVVFNNSPIDGLTMAEGNILLHQELRDAMPGIVLGGERLNDVTFLYESFAQSYNFPSIEHPHPISSFIFAPYTRFYGHLGYPNPDRYPSQYAEFFPEYKIWGVTPTVRLDGVADLDPNFTETYKILGISKRIFGDVNNDGVVNILDLTFIAQHFGTEQPSNWRIDVNSDGVVNILDLTLVARQIN